MDVEHGDSIIDRKHEAVMFTYQLITAAFEQNRSQHSRAKYSRTVAQPAFTDRADQYFHQLLVHQVSLIPVSANLRMCNWLRRRIWLLQGHGKFLER